MENYNERNLYLARLHAERGYLLRWLIGLDEETLTQAAVVGDSTPKDLLAHIAAWDELYAQRVHFVLADRVEEIRSIDMDERNARLHEERTNWTIDQALDAFITARSSFMDAYREASDDLIQRSITLPWGLKTSIRVWGNYRYRHDGAHGRELAAWRRRSKPPFQVGPKSLALAAVDAAFSELNAMIDLVEAAERPGELLWEGHSISAMLGHIADWDVWTLRVLPNILAGVEPIVEEWDGVDVFNDRSIARHDRRKLSDVVRELTANRVQLRNLQDKLTQEQLSMEFEAPWGRTENVYWLLAVQIRHDRDHAADLRKILALPGYAKRLLEVD